MREGKEGSEKANRHLRVSWHVSISKSERFLGGRWLTCSFAYSNTSAKVAAFVSKIVLIRSRFFSSLTWRVEKNRLLFSFLFLFSIQNCQIFREIALLRRYFSRILSCNIFLLPSRVSRALLRLFARQINVSLKGILGSFKKMSELKATKS